jgi:hypothetical protein
MRFAKIKIKGQTALSTRIDNFQCHKTLVTSMPWRLAEALKGG